ncbi:MAG: aminotransferase class I/II-fold pyridoxal phosphate-dependent enzyme [Candidatus Aureabacteria bacterium]|nr:aminotransferase class I/II-fold pyridoxal phosphate-dependent enzyme [Candidatus Auribacterota bacterium]
MKKNKYDLSKMIEALPPSGIREFFDLVLTMDDVVSLGVGEPDFPTPWHICESAIFSIEQGLTSYTSNKGMLDLRSKIAHKIQKKCGVAYDPEEEVLITVGVSEAMDVVLRAILNPGDRVAVIKPSYVSYSPCVIMAGGVPVEIECFPENGFKLDPSDLEKECKKGLKALLLNYPCNPTGVSYTEEELKTIAQIIKNYHLLTLSDEIYDSLTYDFEHTPLLSFPDMKELVIYLNGFSKGYAMTGWRIGYVAAPREITGLANKIHQYTMLCAPIMGQFAAVEALRNGESEVEVMKKEYKRRRNFLVSRLNEMGLKTFMPSGAFYTYSQISSTKLHAKVFAKDLLMKKRVAVVPGTAFSEKGDQYIRISYASSFENIKEALFRMEDFLKELK